MDVLYRYINKRGVQKMTNEKTTIEKNQEAINSMRMTNEEFEAYKSWFEEDFRLNTWKYEGV